MRVQFYSATGSELQEREPLPDQEASALLTPVDLTGRTILQAILFSVAVNVATQVALRVLFPNR